MIGNKKMAEDEKKNVLLKRFVNFENKKIAVYKDRILMAGPLQSMRLLSDDVEHIVSIFLQEKIIIETPKCYEITKKGHYILNNGGYTPHGIQLFMQWIIANDNANYWKLISVGTAILGFFIGHYFK